MSDQQSGAATHWRRTRNLTFVTLGIWFFFAFFIHWFGTELNNYSFLGFPLGFYMAAQAHPSPLSFCCIYQRAVRKKLTTNAALLNRGRTGDQYERTFY